MSEDFAPGVLAVFARANHPRGWGYCSGYEGDVRTDRNCQTVNAPSRSAYGTAHGYVIVIVLCEDAARLALVEKRLRQYPIENAAPANDWNGPRFDPWNRRDDWYGGPYELVWAADADCEAPTDAVGPSGRAFPLGEARSYGDNRACAYLTATEVLGA